MRLLTIPLFHFIFLFYFLSVNVNRTKKISVSIFWFILLNRKSIGRKNKITYLFYIPLSLSFSPVLFFNQRIIWIMTGILYSFVTLLKYKKRIETYWLFEEAPVIFNGNKNEIIIVIISLACGVLHSSTSSSLSLLSCKRDRCRQHL